MLKACHPASAALNFSTAQQMIAGWLVDCPFGNNGNNNL